MNAMPTQFFKPQESMVIAVKITMLNTDGITKKNPQDAAAKLKIRIIDELSQKGIEYLSVTKTDAFQFVFGETENSNPEKLIEFIKENAAALEIIAAIWRIKSRSAFEDHQVKIQFRSKVNLKDSGENTEEIINSSESSVTIREIKCNRYGGKDRTFTAYVTEIPKPSLSPVEPIQNLTIFTDKPVNSGTVSRPTPLYPENYRLSTSQLEPTPGSFTDTTPKNGGEPPLPEGSFCEPGL